MKKFAISLLTASLISSALSADMLLVNHNFDNEFNRMQNYVNSIMAKHLQNTYPQVDMKDMKNQYLIKYNIAGIDKKDIQLSLSDSNILTIKGERKGSKEVKNDSYVQQESFYGKFERSIQLPKNADSTTLKTDYKNGILTVTIAKKEVKKNYKIIPIN